MRDWLVTIGCLVFWASVGYAIVEVVGSLAAK